MSSTSSVEQVTPRDTLEQLAEVMDSRWRHFWFSPGDPLTMSAVRIAAGILSLYYLLTFSFDLVSWFGPEGLLRRESAARLMTDFGQEAVYRFSLFQVSSDPTYLWLIHGTSILIALAFTVGLFTRLTSVLTLLTLLSYTHRAPMITGFLEPVLTFVVAYLCIAPSGHYLSVDAWRRGIPLTGPDPEFQQHPSAVNSVLANLGWRLLQVHLIAFHVMIGFAMLAGETWWVGEAVWWLIAHSESRLVDFTALGATQVGLYFINLLSHLIVAYMFFYGLLVWRPLAFPLVVIASLFIWTFLALVTGAIGYCALMFLLNVTFVPSDKLRGWMERCEWRSGPASAKVTSSGCRSVG
jgi:hypothetical protein